MASSWTPEDDNRPYTGRRAIPNRILNDSNFYAPSQALSQRVDDEATTRNQCAHFMEGEIDQAEGDIQTLKRALEVAEARYYRLSHQHYELRDFDPRIHRVVFHSFAERAEEAQNKIESLEEKLNKKTNEHDSVMSHWQDAIQELEEIKSSKKSLTVDDDTMTSKWKQLQFVTKNLSTTFLYGLATSSISAITEKDLKRYRQLMPMSYGSITENEHSYLCQILIWDFITVKILTIPTIVWGQKVFDSTEKLFAIINSCPDRNRVSTSDFHAFRAQTGEIIKAATDVDLEVCDNLKAELRAQLQPFTSPENAQEVSRQLDNIIDKAVDLATIFTQSRCHYYIRTMDRRRKRLFDPKTMDNVGGKDGSNVHSIISPMFFKYGNSKGENYDERIMLAKAAVLC
ncbi:hypothetical protein F4860DRAFT_527288 [Xylaria cubensis]|nr:hypothetical protein F4860DRAFT_527288 [Xylaria cubensis]